MFTALSYVVAALIRFPLTSVSFLKYDPKDVFLIICGFLMGPLASMIVAVAAAVIEALTVGTTGPIGCLMNILSSVSFVVPAALIYSRQRNNRGAFIGLASGILIMTGVMLLWNTFITPLYMGTPQEAIIPMLLPIFLPFNLVKGGINAGITLLLYKPILHALDKSGLAKRMEIDTASQKTTSIVIYIVGTIVLIGCIAAVLLMTAVN